MSDVPTEREFLVVGFQVGLSPATVGVQLQLLASDGGSLAPVVLRLTPAMAQVFADHLREASAAVALGPAPTDVRQ